MIARPRRCERCNGLLLLTSDDVLVDDTPEQMPHDCPKEAR